MTVVDDLHQFAGLMAADCRAKHPNAPKLPHILIGHSMGGLVALLSALQCTPGTPQLSRVDDSETASASSDSLRWDAVVASASAVVVDPELATPPLKAAARVLGTLLPKMGQSDISGRGHFNLFVYS
jgi:alpha-beta hydrolase superfamily lysophospholipase